MDFRVSEVAFLPQHKRESYNKLTKEQHAKDIGDAEKNMRSKNDYVEIDPQDQVLFDQSVQLYADQTISKKETADKISKSIDVFKLFKSKLDEFNGTARKLYGNPDILESLFESKKSVITTSQGDLGTYLNVTIDSNATVGSHTVTVSSLASPKSITLGTALNTGRISVGYNSNAILGNGVNDIQLTAGNYYINTNAGNLNPLNEAQYCVVVPNGCTPSQLVSAVNSVRANTKVKAELIKLYNVVDGNGQKVLDGSGNAIVNYAIKLVSTVNGVGTNDFKIFDSNAYTDVTNTWLGGNSTRVSAAAADGSIVVDDAIMSSSPDNVFTNVIDGLSMQARAVTGVGVYITIDIQRDVETIQSGITEFLNKYNALLTIEATQKRSHYSTSDDSALLTDNSTFNDIMSAMHLKILPQLKGYSSNSAIAFRSLAELGITQDDMSPSIDGKTQGYSYWKCESSTLQKACNCSEDDFLQIRKLFEPSIVIANDTAVINLSIIYISKYIDTSNKIDISFNSAGFNGQADHTVRVNTYDSSNVLENTLYSGWVDNGNGTYRLSFSEEHPLNGVTFLYSGGATADYNNLYINQGVASNLYHYVNAIAANYNTRTIGDTDYPVMVDGMTGLISYEIYTQQQEVENAEREALAAFDRYETSKENALSNISVNKVKSKFARDQGEYSEHLLNLLVK